MTATPNDLPATLTYRPGEVPTTGRPVTRSEVAQIAQSLGFDPATVQSINIGPRAITVREIFVIPGRFAHTRETVIRVVADA